jgi:hypothetical protein
VITIWEDGQLFIYGKTVFYKINHKKGIAIISLYPDVVVAETSHGSITLPGNKALAGMDLDYLVFNLADLNIPSAENTNCDILIYRNEKLFGLSGMIQSALTI